MVTTITGIFNVRGHFSIATEPPALDRLHKKSTRADEYLINPWIRRRCFLRWSAASGLAGGAAPARPILVVEDDASTREMIEELLTARSYSVITAADGAPRPRPCGSCSLPELVISRFVLPR